MSVYTYVYTLVHTYVYTCVKLCIVVLGNSCDSSVYHYSKLGSAL